LSFFWVMAGFLLYLRLSGEGARARKKAWLICGCFMLAMASKPAAVIFVLMILLLELFTQGRVRWGLWHPLLALTVPAVAISIHTQQAVRNPLDDLMSVPLFGRAINAIASLGIYLKQSIYPDALRVPCLPVVSGLPEFFWPALGICVILGVFALFLCMRVLHVRMHPAAWPSALAFKDGDRSTKRLAKLYILCVCGFLVSVGPTLGIVPFGYHARADRFTYLPAFWLSVLLTGFLASIVEKRKEAWVRRGLVSLVVLWCGALAVQTAKYLRHWENTETVARRALAFEPDNMVANKNLATHLFLTGSRSAEFRGRTVRMAVQYQSPPIYILAITMLIKGGYLEDATHVTGLFLKKIEDDRTGIWDVHYRIASAFDAFCSGDITLAKQHFLHVEADSPSYAPVQFMLGAIAAREGDWEKTAIYWRVASKDPMFRGTLGN